MREFVAIFVVTQFCYWAGYARRWYETRPKPMPALTGVCEGCGEQRPCPEFKAWLLDYIAVNRP